MDICVLCITQSTSSLFYRLLFVIYHLHLSSAYFYPAARNRIFFTRRLTSGSRRVAFIKLFLFFNDMPSFCILFPFAYCLIMTAAVMSEPFTRRLFPAAGVISSYTFSMFYIHDWCFLIHCHFSAAFTCFLYILSAMIYSVIFLAYFDILYFAMYWLLPEAGLLLDIITYPGSSSCSALSACTVFLSLMSDVLIHSVHDI